MEQECIICRKLKKENEFSDEHVIPESIGGYYHIYTVCRDCNSKLGQRVDSAIVNHSLTKFHRYLYNLAGKSGKIPSPFSSNNSTLCDDPTQKVKISTNNIGDMDCYFIPKISTIDDILSTGEISITLDKRDESKIEPILNGLSKRLNIPLDELKQDLIISQHKAPIHIRDTITINTLNFKIGLLKIAYEFAVDSIPEYYMDEKSILISKILFSADYKAVDTHSFLLDSGFDPNFLELIPGLTRTNLISEHDYVLVLLGSNRGTFCIIHLAELFNTRVLLSTKNYLGKNLIFGINDFKQHHFFKYSSLYEFIKTRK